MDKKRRIGMISILLMLTILFSNFSNIVIGAENTETLDEHTHSVDEKTIKENTGDRVLSGYEIPITVIGEDIQQEELDYAAEILGRTVEEISYSSVLYDADGTPTFLLVEFQTGGYIIIYREKGVFIEYSNDSAGSPYSFLKSQEKYYINPTEYAYKSGNDVLSVHTDKAIDKAVLKESAEFVDYIQDYCEKNSIYFPDVTLQKNSTQTIQEDEIENLTSANTLAAEPYVYRKLLSDDAYFSSMPFPRNEIGECGPVAAAMLLRYYDEKRNSSLIDASNTSHMETVWYPKFKEYYPDYNESGTSAWNEADKINTYLGSVKSNLGYKASWGLIGLPHVQNSINAGNPLVIYGYWTSEGNHAMLMFGYEERTYVDYLGTATTVIAYKVHNGWHSSCPSYVSSNACNAGIRSDLYITSFVFGSTLWLETGNHTAHSFTNYFSSIGSGYRCYKCTGCNLIEKVHYDHIYTGATAYNSTTHWNKCYAQDCNATSVPSQHFYSFGSTTCQCGYSHTHIWNNSWSKGTTTHWKDCTVTNCYATTSAANHNYGTSTTCTVCGQTHTHNISYLYNSSQHWQKCNTTGCSFESTKTNHSYGTSSTCSVCGQYHNHNLSYLYNSLQHWQKCNTVGCSFEMPKENHRYILSNGTLCLCGSTHSHTYTYSCSTTCNSCGGGSRSASHALVYVQNSSSGHYTRCINNCGYQTSTVAHGWASTSYTSSAHTKRCGSCGYESTSSHSLVSGSCTYKYCSGCSYTTGNSSHAYSWYQYSSTQHCKKCVYCGLLTDYAAHGYITSNGVKKCGSCGYIPK